MENTITEQLATYATTDHRALYTSDDYKMAKLSVLDWIAAAYTGTSEKSTQLILGVSCNNETEESTLIGQNRKVSMPSAALVNGMESHAIDFDDIHDFLSLHLCSPIMPAALAVGEKLNVSGDIFLDAIMTGVQIMVALSSGVMPEHYNIGRWHATSTLGIFGAASAAGRLLGLTKEQMQNAFGICAGLCSGIQLNFGTMSKPLVVGLAAKNGVLAAALALKGFTGNDHIFDTDFLENIARKTVEGKYISTRLMDKQGIHELRFKRYPCGAPTHSGIINCKKILARHHAAVHDIDKIVFYPYPRAIRLVGITHPTTGLQGKFSIPFTAAAQIVFGKVTIQTFTDENVRNPDVCYLLDRMEMIPDDSFTPSRGGKMVMYFKDGSVEENSTFLLGHDIDLDETMITEKEKFLEVMSTSPNKSNIDKLYEKISHLESLNNIQKLSALL